MKRIILFLMLFMITTVSAYTIGTTITQEQYDNQDFLNSNLDIEGGVLIREGNMIKANATINTLERIENSSDWVIVEKELVAKMPYSWYDNCKINIDKSICKERVILVLKKGIIRKRNLERIKLESQKTNTIYDIFNEVIEV